MNKGILESYKANERLIKRNKEKIEEERCREVPSIQGKVKGSSNEFPYIERRFTVEMEDPVEEEKKRRRIQRLQNEIHQAAREMETVEIFVQGIMDVRDREILTYRYIDGAKVTEIADKLGYTHGRVSQLISKYLKD